MTSGYAKSCSPHVPENEPKARWIISPPTLYLLEQVFKMEHFPSLHMRQRLAADLNVSARQVRRRALPPPPPPPRPRTPGVPAPAPPGRLVHPFGAPEMAANAEQRTPR